MPKHARTFKTEWHNDVLVLEFRGDLVSLDADNHAQVIDHLIPMFDDRPPPRLVVDVRRLEKADSTFVALLVQLWKTLTPRDGKLVLASVNQTFRSVLHYSKLDTVWEIYASSEEAIAAIES